MIVGVEPARSSELKDIHSMKHTNNFLWYSRGQDRKIERSLQKKTQAFNQEISVLKKFEKISEEIKYAERVERLQQPVSKRTIAMIKFQLPHRIKIIELTKL